LVPDHHHGYIGLGRQAHRVIEFRLLIEHRATLSCTVSMDDVGATTVRSPRRRTIRQLDSTSATCFKLHDRELLWRLHESFDHIGAEWQGDRFVEQGLRRRSRAETGQA
jgi:hypothetical protein